MSLKPLKTRWAWIVFCCFIPKLTIEENLVKTAFLLAAFVSFQAFASDHIDGPVTMKHRVADLTDFYAFPTPNKAGFVTLILNTYPVVLKSEHFTDKVTYVFMIRKAVVNATQKQIETNSEVLINCKVQTPDDHDNHNHQITCKSTNALLATSTYNVLSPAKATDNFRLFAGMRSDPFFFNSDFAQDAATKKRINAPNSNNIMADMNVLSIAIEMDMNKIYPQGHTGSFAFATAVFTRDTPQSEIRILDRIGRPEITNVSLVSQAGDTDIRDRFNIDRPFNVLVEAQRAYEARLVKNMTYYDGLDKKIDLNEFDKINLARLLADDFLVLDTTKPCTKNSFLEIEKSIVKGSAINSCGGRHPNDDIMDTLFTTYIAGLNGSRIRDGVDAPKKAVSHEFPHLAAPSTGLLDQIKARVARGLLGL